MNNKHIRIWIGLLVIVTIWLVASIIMAKHGLFDQSGKPPVFFGVFLGGSITSFLLAYKANSALREALLAIPLWLVAATHILRLVGIFFVIGAAHGVLAPQFGIPAGIGDIVAAIASIPLMATLRRGYHSARLRRSFIAWNIFGLADLFSAVTLGLLYSQSTVGILSRPGVDSQALTHLPLSIIPTFYVPLLILLHVLALRRYREL